MRDRDAGSIVIERLRRRSDFRAAADGVRTSGKAFMLHARQRSEAGAARVGFTVSRQVGNAVERNRVRRRLREMVRISAAGQTGLLRPGHDYVLIGRRAALAAPFGEMMRDLDAALCRIHAAKPAERGGTGGFRRDRLHEVGSPSKARRSHRSQQRKSPSKPPSHPPREP